jgi:hypothetical protein
MGFGRGIYDSRSAESAIFRRRLRNFEIKRRARKLLQKEKSLKAALTEIVGYGGGTFVSCIAGKLGYFESDEATDRFILERK